MTTDIDLTSQSTDTVDIVGLNDINATLNLQLPQPLQTESSDSLTVAPLKADLTSPSSPSRPSSTPTATSRSIRSGQTATCQSISSPRSSIYALPSTSASCRMSA